MRPKDTVDPAKQDGIVYKTLYEYGKVYIGETGKSIQESIKEHDRDIRLARSQETGHYPIQMDVSSLLIEILTVTHVVSITRKLS